MHSLYNFQETDEQYLLVQMFDLCMFQLNKMALKTMIISSLQLRMTHFCYTVFCVRMVGISTVTM